MKKATVKVMNRKATMKEEPQEGPIADLMRQVLGHLGEDPTREGLLRTPGRADRALQFLTSGYSADLSTIVNDALFDVEYDEMVIVKDIELFSLCEHHMLPFFGKVHVAYIPKGKVIGLSKIPPLVEVFARRLQVQERLTRQIADTIQEAIKPQGVGVIMRSAPSLHDDARSGEAALGNSDERYARRIPQEQGDARRVPLLDKAGRIAF